MSFSEQCNNFPNDWKKLISKWGKLNARYFKQHGDLPAWHVEISNTALLSAAAWMCEYTALCEPYAEKRRFTGKRGRPRTYGGRIDMDISIEGTNYWVEAKRRNFLVSEKSGYSLRHSYLRKSLSDVMGELESCRRCASEYKAKLAGIVFFSGHIDPWAEERSSGSSPTQRRQMVETEIDKMHNNIKKIPKNKDFSIYHAVFCQKDFKIGKQWKDWDWPAVFGVCAALDV